MKKLILASASPRRSEILRGAGVRFTVMPTDTDESVDEGMSAAERAELLAARKCRAAAERIADDPSYDGSRDDIFVLAADTVVECFGQTLGKPRDREDARRMLSMLSGKKHSVYTGVTFVFIDKDGRTGEHCFYEKTDVSMYTLTEDEIDRYISSGDPMDKAGSYGIQGRFAIHIKGIQGDYNNVVGLPVARLYQELKKLGVSIWEY